MNLAIDGSDHAGEARRVLEVYASQRGSWRRTLRTKCYAASLYAGREWVDEFWELTAEAYVRLHADATTEAGRFEGLRPNAFRDPWVYLSGLRARRELLGRVRGH